MPPDITMSVRACRSTLHDPAQGAQWDRYPLRSQHSRALSSGAQIPGAQLTARSVARGSIVLRHPSLLPGAFSGGIHRAEILGIADVADEIQRHIPSALAAANEVGGVGGIEFDPVEGHRRTDQLAVPKAPPTLPPSTIEV